MRTHSRNAIVMAAVLSIALFGSLARPSYAFLDKTRFVAHLGVAYFCFHHWVLKPMQDGDFNSGAPHRTASLIKGGAALLFAVHEVQVSEKIARNSNSPILHKLDGKIVGLAASFAAVGTALKAGQFHPDQIKSLTATTQDVQSDSTAPGEPIKDVPVPDVGKEPAGSAADSNS